MEKEKIKLWTVQPVEVLDIIEKDGVFTASEDKIAECWDGKNGRFVRSYNWLIQEMAKRGVKGKGYPVWAWYRRNGRFVAPTKRKLGKGEVMMELLIDADRVVLTDFDGWSYVLHQDYCGYPWDRKLTMAEFDAIYDAIDALPKAEREKVILDSWQKIFNTKFWRRGESTNGVNVQATFFELKKEDIVHIYRQNSLRILSFSFSIAFFLKICYNNYIDQRRVRNERRYYLVRK